jgi:protein TilB
METPLEQLGIRITPELIRQKSEHHDAPLSELFEISLHQMKIIKIETLGKVCNRLRILYLQSNLISKIEGLHRLKDLEYLNLALNNVTMIENLESCEKLNKLDLTLNFIDLDTFELSINNLRLNEKLTTLYFTGNPCTSWEPWKNIVLARLPHLKYLDGVEVVPSQVIEAKMHYPSSLQELRARALEVREKKERDRKELNKEKLDPEKSYAYTAELRMEMARIEQEEEREKKRKKLAEEKSLQPPDYMAEAKAKMNRKEESRADGTRPRMRNVPKYIYQIDETPGEMICTIEVPRFLATSEIDVDIHPTWFQIAVKGDRLLLHLDEEVLPDSTKLHRITTNGKLVIKMPKLNLTPTSNSSDAKLVALPHVLGAPKTTRTTKLSAKERRELERRERDKLEEEIGLVPAKSKTINAGITSAQGCQQIQLLSETRGPGVASERSKDRRKADRQTDRQTNIRTVSSPLC